MNCKDCSNYDNQDRCPADCDPDLINPGIKIILTLSDFRPVLNSGSDISRESFIIKVPAERVPDWLKKYLADPALRRLQTVALSISNDEGVIENVNTD